MGNTTATQIYTMQNKALHRGFASAGMPYEANKEVWLPLIREAAGMRSVNGLSDLTLGQRYRMIQHFKMPNIYNPTIPKHLWHWKKGQEDKAASSGRPVKVPESKEACMSKISAILTELKLPWAYADGIAWKRFGVERVEWLPPDSLHKVMQMLIYHQNRNKKKKEAS